MNIIPTFDLHSQKMMAIASTKVNGNTGMFRKGYHASPATEFKKGHTSYNKTTVQL
jgi:hypothetical protein